MRPTLSLLSLVDREMTHLSVKLTFETASLMLTPESTGFQKDPHQKDSATSATAGSIVYPEIKDPGKRILYRITMNYLQTLPPQSREEHNMFKQYVKKMKALITGISVECSLVISVQCYSLESLEGLVRRLLMWHS